MYLRSQCQYSEEHTLRKSFIQRKDLLWMQKEEIRMWKELFHKIDYFVLKTFDISVQYFDALSMHEILGTGIVFFFSHNFWKSFRIGRKFES